MTCQKLKFSFLLLEYCKIRECYAVANAFTIKNVYSLFLYMKCNSRKINRPTKNMTTQLLTPCLTQLFICPLIYGFWLHLCYLLSSDLRLLITPLYLLSSDLRLLITPLYLLSSDLRLLITPLLSSVLWFMASGLKFLFNESTLFSMLILSKGAIVQRINF